MTAAHVETRDESFFVDHVDPWVRLAISDLRPWDAYERIYEFIHLFHESEVVGRADCYTVWIELTDLMEIGQSPLHDKHTAIQIIAVDWLRRTRSSDPDFVSGWLARSSSLIEYLFIRDGNAAWSSRSTSTLVDERD